MTEDVGTRYEAYGWHVQTVDWRGEDGRTRGRRAPAGDRAAKAETDRPSFIALRTIIGWPAPNKQNTGKLHGSALGDDEVAATKEILGFDPDETLRRRPTRCSRTPAQVVERGRAAHAEWQRARSTPGPQANPRARGSCSTGCRPARCPTAGPTRCRASRPTPKGVGHPQGLRQGARRARAGAARAVGRLGRPGREQQHHDGGRAVASSRPSTPDQGVARRPVRPHAALRHPRARHGLDHQRHRAARRHPRLRRHVPGLQRLHAPAGPAGRADEAAGHLRLDARLDRPRRGRPDPPADRAPRRAARDPRPRRGPPGRRQRDRRRLADDPRAHRPAGRRSPDPAEPARSSTAREYASAEGVAQGRLHPGRGRRAAAPR